VIFSYLILLSIINRFCNQGTKFFRVGIHIFCNSRIIHTELVESAKKLFLFYFEPNIFDFNLFQFSESVIIDEVLDIFIPDDDIFPKICIFFKNILM